MSRGHNLTAAEIDQSVGSGDGSLKPPWYNYPSTFHLVASAIYEHCLTLLFHLGCKIIILSIFIAWNFVRKKFPFLGGCILLSKNIVYTGKTRIYA